jgi:UDP-sugar pyrophosphorylase
MENLTDQEVVALFCSPDYSQAHLFPKGLTTEACRSLVSQLRHFDRAYAGGIASYIQHAKALLSDSAVHPFQDFHPDIPAVEVVNAEDVCQLKALEAIGLSELSKCCFVLVAGGLGERLHYSRAKVTLPIEVTTHTSYLEFYVQSILAYQDRIKTPLPLVVMTSEVTHADTLQLLEAHDYFGMNRSQLTLLKCSVMVPAFLDNEARFEVKHGVISSKPHGHGDVHTKLLQSGLLQKWVGAGNKWVMFFQDTNALAFTAFLSFLGVSAQYDYDMNFMTAPRVPKEASGGIIKITKGEETHTVNIEYNQIEGFLKLSGWNDDGDVDNAALGLGTQGTVELSPFPANTNVLMMNLSSYLETLERTGGVVPEFVNPKYSDATKTTFQTPARVECMMQDFAHLLPSGSRIGCTLFDRWFCFSAAKNSLELARDKVAQGLPPQTVGSAEADFYQANARRLQLAGVRVGDPLTQTFAGLSYDFWPKIVIKPSFAISLSELEAKLTNVQVSSRSALILEGIDSIVTNLLLDGALHITRSTVDLQYTGETVELIEAEASDPEEERIRGYKPVSCVMYSS